MPGTGKTEVIATLLKILIENGQRVLITSYTHSAIDNMLKRFLKKFEDDGRKILRLGDEGKIDKEVAKLLKKHPTKKEDEESKMIFAVTCLGINNQLLRKNFHVIYSYYL